MMKVILTGVLMMLLSVVASGSDLFSQANDDFGNGRYEEAAKSYEKLLDEGPRVAVLNNLGSAYFRGGDYGRSILAFDRALLLSPGDPDLLANIKLAQDQAAVFDEDFATSWSGAIMGKFRNVAAWIVLVVAIGLPLMVLLLIKFRVKLRWVVVLMVLILPVLIFGLRLIWGDDPQELRGIVLAKPATVRLSPFETAESRGTLSSGREVKMGEMKNGYFTGQKKNGYFWIDASGGAIQGWVHEDEVARVIPSQSVDD